MAGRHRGEPKHPPGLGLLIAMLVAGAGLLALALFGINAVHPEEPKSTPYTGCTPHDDPLG